MTAVTSANVDGFFGSGSICFAGSCSESNCPINAQCVSPTTIDCECKNGYVSDSSASDSIVSISTSVKKHLAMKRLSVRINQAALVVLVNSAFTETGFFVPT